jgi:hypothetical protein
VIVDVSAFAVSEMLIPAGSSPPKASCEKSLTTIADISAAKLRVPNIFLVIFYLALSTALMRLSDNRAKKMPGIRSEIINSFMPLLGVHP